MGWLWLGVLGAIAAGALWRLKLPRGLWSFIGAALMLGATGYALQGRPFVESRPTKAASVAGEIDPVLSDLRLQMFGKFTYAEPYFIGSDGLIRAGAKSSAVSMLLGGVGAQPTNAALWTALGQAYANHDGGTVSPAAKFAFDQAMRLAPQHPGPPFFLGMAYVQAGTPADGRKWWVRAYRLSPPGSGYQQEIGVRLRLLDGYLAGQQQTKP